MCDTFVATPEFTSSGNMIFAKNSDREPNEAQGLIRIPRREWKEPTLKVTYLEVPQVSETNEVILSKPFQIWGAEMGANEHGLVIGNEAIFTKVRFDKTRPGLTGMDMLRLALERCRTAQQALGMITDLLAQYGQDACGGYQNRNFYYHNGFVIADPREAYVLETAGREWAAVRVKGYRALSNGIAIEEEFDYSSPGLIDRARAEGWLRKGETFNFKKAYSDWFYTTFGKCRARFDLSMRLGAAERGKLDARGAMRILRSHGDVAPGDFNPARCSMGALCIHETGVLTPTQTTGSLVAELRRDRASTYWVTGSAAPCLSVFKPFFTGTSGVIDQGSFPEPGPTLDGSLWWRSERLHRLALTNYRAVTGELGPERDRMEADYGAAEQDLLGTGAKSVASTEELQALSRRALREGDEALARWTSSAQRQARPSRFAPIYDWHWNRLNRKGGVGRSALAAN